MSFRTVIFIVAAAISAAVSGNAQAAPIAPLPATVAADTGNLTPVYYYGHHYRYHSHYHYYHRHHYHHYYHY
jgi:hypothetical protein